MNQQTLHIDELLSNSFAAFEPALPDMAWKGIEAKLNNAERRKGGFFWWKTAAVVGIASVGSWAAFQYFSEKNASPVQPVQTDLSRNTDNSENSENSGTSGNSDKQNSGADVAIPGNSGTGSSPNIQPTSPPINNPNPEIRKVSPKTAEPQIQKPAEKTTEKTEDNQARNTAGESQFNIIAHNASRIREYQIEDPEWTRILKEYGKSIAILTPPYSPKVKLNNHLMLGLGIGQAVSNTGYTINSSLENYVHPNFRKEMKNGEGLLASLNLNAGVYYQPFKTKNWFITSGISFYQRKNSLNFNFGRPVPLEDGTKPKDKFGYLPFINIDNLGQNKDTVTFKGTNTYTQFEIPVGMMFDLRFGYRRQWSFMPSAGVHAGFITQTIGNTLNYHELEVEKLDPTWFRTTYFGLNAGLGLYRNFTSHLKLGVSAAGSYMMSAVYNTDLPVRPRALTGGLSTQLIWRID